MATAVLINSEISIVPMADADLAGLERLFDEECAEWLELLKWDFKGASMLVRDVVRERRLSGFVAMSGDAAVGFTYYLVEGSRCALGDIYVSRSWRGRGIDREMALAFLAKIDRVSRVRRIESQYVGIGNDEADATFQARGFERLERYYKLLSINEAPEHREASSLADAPDEEASISIRPWAQNDFAQAARIIHRSYCDTADSRINSQYRTEEGCAELLAILTDHIWCGDFLGGVSCVALRPSGSLAGVLIASRVSSGVGHIGQISVHPAHQNRGIGRRLIETALEEFRRRGFSKVTLAVTNANQSADHLYESCGFRTIHTFPVFYREKA